MFSMKLVSSNLASINQNSSEVDIFVAASDGPHGVVQFSEPLAVLTEEGVGTLFLPLQRTLGLVGSVRVNFTVVPGSSSALVEDFSLPSLCECACMYVCVCVW